MSNNISQVYTNNPSSSLSDNDLMYIGKDPYGSGDDSAITYSNLFNQIQSGIGWTAASLFGVYGGSGSSANGVASMSFGSNCASNGNFSIALGSSCSSSGSFSAAIGRLCTASGTNSFAFGLGSTASGTPSFAYGAGTAAHNGSFVIGDSSYSVSSSADYQFVSSFSGGYLFRVANTTAVSIDTTFNLINIKGTADQSYSLQTLVNGFDITIDPGVKTLIINASGTLALGTVTMPASPVDGQEIRISSNQDITSFTLSPNIGQTISNAPITFVAGSGFSYIYNLSGTNWYRLY